MKALSGLALSAGLSVLTPRSKMLTQQPFRQDDNLIRVQAEVNGMPLTAVLDSGTSQIILDREAAQMLDVHPSGASVSGLGGGTGTQALRSISIKSVRFGPVRLRATQGFSMELMPLSRSAGFKIGALLGGPLFASSIIKVDYREHLVDIIRPQQAIHCRNPLPISIVAGVPVVTAVLRTGDATSPRQLRLIIDLGTRHFAAMIGGSFLNTKDAEELVLTGTPTQIGTGTGGKVEGSVVQISELQLGRQTFTGLQVAFTREIKAFESGTIDGTLGVPLWRGGSITFDYPHRRVCIVPGRGA